MSLKYKPVYISHPKYDCRTANGVNGCVGYWVKLYLVYCDDVVHTLYDNDSWIDAILLMQENGSQCTSFTHDILVTPTRHSAIYNDILNYVLETDIH